MMNISFGFENPLKSVLGEDFLQTVPTSAGVYFFLDVDRAPLYIGKANHLKKRVGSYFQAKPGQAPEHILEMLEHAHSLVWECHSSGDEALVREAQLIRTIKPSYNIALTHEIASLFCGLRRKPASKNGKISTEFRLSHTELPPGFETFGCFLNRGKTKSGYSALLRLLAVASSEKSRMSLPSKLCRTSPAYAYALEIREDLLTPLCKFLRGESPELLNRLVKTLLEIDHIEAHHYAPLQRDIVALRSFFAACAEPTRELRIQSRGSESRSDGFLPQRLLEERTRKKGLQAIARLAARQARVQRKTPRTSSRRSVESGTTS